MFKEGFKLKLLGEGVLNPSHVKANGTNKHPGTEVGQQAVKRAPEKQEKRPQLISHLQWSSYTGSVMGQARRATERTCLQGCDVIDITET